MAKNFNPFRKMYNLETFSDNLLTVRGQYDLANSKKQVISLVHIASGQKIKFQAFLDTYNESYRSDWSSTRVYGRNDPIQTFKGTERTLRLQWKIPSNSVDESEENLLRVQKLIQMLYPVYEELYQGSGVSATSIKAPPLIRLRFANLIRDVSHKTRNRRGFEDGSGLGLVGAISNLSYTPDVPGQSGWDDPQPGVLYPKLISLSFTFNVMHTHPLGFVSKGKEVRVREPRFPFGVGVEEPSVAASKDISKTTSAGNRKDRLNNSAQAKIREQQMQKEMGIPFIPGPVVPTASPVGKGKVTTGEGLAPKK